MRARTGLAIALAAAVLAAVSAFAAPFYPDSSGTGVVPMAVNGCVNGSSQAVPCAAATPLITAPAGPYASGATAITADSGNVAAATATATLAAVAAKTTYICGFTITSSGSTAAAAVNATITNTITGTLTFTYTTVAGATLGNQPLVVSFANCIPANAANTTIVVSLPSLGTGNAHADVNAWGFQL